MAVRYLAIIGRSGNTSDLVNRLEKSSGLKLVLQQSDLCIFTNGTPVSLADARGLVLGDVFSREDRPRPVEHLDEATCRQILKSGGAYLTRAIWGGYVAIIRNAELGQISVYRDPSAALPCYHVQTREELVFSSDVDTLVTCGFLKPDIDWAYLGYHLFSGGLRQTRTALAGVAELLPGWALTSKDAETHLSAWWSPWDHVASSDGKSDREDHARLRSLIVTCTEAWAKRFNHPLLGVSGGLDSSILSAALAGIDREFTCLTLATDDAKGDERAYARCLANSLGLRLKEAFYRIDEVNFETSVSAHLPRPAGFAFSQSNTRAKLDTVETEGVDALFSGTGGDNVFCYLQSASPLLDRLTSEGLTPGLWSTINDICRLTGCSYIDLFKLAIHQVWSGSRYRWAGNERFLAADRSVDASLSLNHPWLVAPPGAKYGKIGHIAMLVRVQSAIEGYSRDLPPQVLPLLSQPIIEACLSIPSWKWCEGGENRAIVRRAFSDLLPEEIVNRRTKGGPDTFVFQCLRAHLSLVRDMLLGGQLAQNGLLDRPALEQVLATDHNIRAPDHMRLSALCEAEAWSRHWVARGKARLV